MDKFEQDWGPRAAAAALAGMHLYEVTLVEREHPPHRDGMRFLTRTYARNSRAAAGGFRDRFVIVDVRRVKRVGAA